MANTYTQLLDHIIFSTKNRVPSLDTELKARLFPYMGDIIRNLDGVALGLNGAEDHVHILASLPPTIAPAEFIGKLKANASGWVHKTFPDRPDFKWQVGYSAFSVSSSLKQTVLNYIARQEEHHRKLSFKEELIAFLKKHGVEYDERYVFE